MIDGPHYRGMEYIPFEDFLSFGDTGKLIAIVASTSPKRSMDIKRADACFAAIEKRYGNIQNYKGLWIAAGELNTDESGVRRYEDSQRKNIVNRFIALRVNPERIIQIDGSDTVDKIRELAKIPEIRDERKRFFVGIASYQLHLSRFGLAWRYARKEGAINNNFRLVGIEMPYESLFLDTNPFRLGDYVAGYLGLLKDKKRLNQKGFSGSLPGQGSALYKKAREFNSEDRRGRKKN